MKLTFTPSLFFQHATCPHWIWHDIYSDKRLKGEVPELAQKLLEQGVLHEANFIKDLQVETVDPQLTGMAAIRATEQLMHQAVPYIYQGALTATINTVQYRGRPDLLEKRLGQSQLGEYYYAPIDIKNSRDIKREHWLQLVTYSQMLEVMQGTFPDEVAIINAEKQRINFTIDASHRQKTEQKVAEILGVIQGNKPPLKLVSSCKNSPWFSQCIAEAEAANDIALIYKLDARAMEGLRKLGLNTVKQAADMDITGLPKLPYVTQPMLERIKLQAESLTRNSIIQLDTPVIPDAPIKIYFDIEGDPLLRIEYLFGFWVVEDTAGRFKTIGNVRPDKTSTAYYIYFIAKQPEDESQMWTQFLQWLNMLKGTSYRMYHFADYERTRTKNLASKYTPNVDIDWFLENLVDLSKIVQQSVIFPLYFYSIKDIAKSRFLSYKWRHPKAGGAQSIFWYEKWLESGDQQVLDDIINYNEDDVVATEYLHQWLLKQASVTN